MQMEGGTFRGKKKREEEAWDYYGTRKDCVSSRWREISYGSNLISQNLHLL
jgi:hypothetical protein